MFERCADPTRHAIFYARAVATLNDSPAIDSVHLLYGLMWKSESRAEMLFRLREIFPLHCGCPWKFTSLESAPKSNPQLTDDAKRILARTAWEADAARDYWIDTEHLLLGILGEKTCLAAQHLAKADVTLKSARRVIAENKGSRPDYGPVSPWWGPQSPWERLWFKWQSRKYAR
jgi:ATP-dependent Clp protease ATP-binding subunit ClpA